ncbi:hypothetical protein [Corynebacterium meridianum]|uniref:Uncharacterized protein n=1 Tax=Corynebacterium meridianum TaxID=2765363 RepID=A0A934I3W7_9CORY|nr:hypothetical protein [Corynebacterium meridianum]MBI8989666.1 hypothetical protein [Corynebacterium meridianum]
MLLASTGGAVTYRAFNLDHATWRRHRLLRVGLYAVILSACAMINWFVRGEGVVLVSVVFWVVAVVIQVRNTRTWAEAPRTATPRSGDPAISGGGPRRACRAIIAGNVVPRNLIGWGLTAVAAVIIGLTDIRVNWMILPLVTVMTGLTSDERPDRWTAFNGRRRIWLRERTRLALLHPVMAAAASLPSVLIVNPDDHLITGICRWIAVGFLIAPIEIILPVLTVWWTPYLIVIMGLTGIPVVSPPDTGFDPALYPVVGAGFLIVNYIVADRWLVRRWRPGSRGLADWLGMNTGRATNAG